MAALGAGNASAAAAAVVVVPRRLLHRVQFSSRSSRSRDFTALASLPFTFPPPPSRLLHHQRRLQEHHHHAASSASCSSSSALLPKLPARLQHSSRRTFFVMAPLQSFSAFPSPLKAVLTAEVGLAKPAETTLPDFEAVFIVRAKRCISSEREAATNVSHLSEQQERQKGRRQAFATILLLCTVPIVLTQMPRKLLAEEAKNEAANSDQSVVGGLLSLFDPNETTKQGKKLPKAYLKSAREVVQTLRASFSEDSKNDAKFRRNADSAKGAIRDYISNWRGAKLVDAEESYEALERALRILSEFYSKKGPSAALPEDVRGRILDALQKADDAL